MLTNSSLYFGLVCAPFWIDETRQANFLGSHLDVPKIIFYRVHTSHYLVAINFIHPFGHKNIISLIHLLNCSQVVKRVKHVQVRRHQRRMRHRHIAELCTLYSFPDSSFWKCGFRSHRARRPVRTCVGGQLKLQLTCPEKVTLQVALCEQ